MKNAAVHSEISQRTNNKYLLGDSMMNKLPYDLQKEFRQSEIRIQIP